VIEYYDENQCYLQTGLEADNVPPISGRSTVSCNQDYWLSGGMDASFSNRKGKLLASNFYRQDMGSYSGFERGLDMLVVDIDNDGRMDFMDRTGSIELLGNNSFSAKTLYPLSFDLDFQFSFAGITDVSGKQAIDSTVTTLGTAVVGYDGGNTDVLRYKNGSWTQTYAIPHPLPGLTMVTGTTCAGDFCFFALANSSATLLRRLNWKSGVDVGTTTGLVTGIPLIAKSPVVLRRSADSVGSYVVFVGGVSTAAIASCKYDNAGFIPPCGSLTLATHGSATVHQPSFAGFASDGQPLVAVVVENVVSSTKESDVFLLKVASDGSLSQVAKYPIPAVTGLLGLPAEYTYGFSDTTYSKCSGSDGFAVMKGWRTTVLGKYDYGVEEGTFRTYCFKNTASGVELYGSHDKLMVFNNQSVETLSAPYNVMPYSIASADVNVDDYDDVVTPFGIVSFKDKQVSELRSFDVDNNQFNPWNARAVQPVDVNGDGYMDFIVGATKSGDTKRWLFLSDGGAYVDECSKTPKPAYCSAGVVGYCATPSIAGVQCDYDALTGKVFMTPIGACSPHPQSTVFKGELYDQVSDAVTYFSEYESALLGYVAVPGSRITLPKGNYNGKLIMRDTAYRTGATYNEYIATCNDIVVDEQAQSTKEGCSLFPDGEFNFYDSPYSHGWVAESGQFPTRQGLFSTANSKNGSLRAGLMVLSGPSMVSGKYADFYSVSGFDGVAALHELSCSASLVAYDVYLSILPSNVESDSGIDDVDFRIATYVRGAGDVNVPFSQVILRYDGATGRNVLVQTGPGEFQALTYIVPSAFYKITLENDLKNGKFRVLIGDSPFGVFDAMNTVAYESKGIELFGLDGKVRVDYVRPRIVTNETEGLTSEQVVKGAAKNYLKSCVDRRDRIGEYTVTVGIGTGQTQQLKMPPGTKYYNTIKSYCETLYAGGLQPTSYCDADSLRESVRVNPGCYWEAMNYCVAVTYPNSAGFSDSWLQQYSPNDEATRTDGTVACTVLLSSTSAIERTARPLFFAATSVLSQDALFGIVVVGSIVIIVIGGLAAARRRRY
jgi:hypothetical protein